MHYKILSTCSSDNNMHWVCIQYHRQEIPWRLFLLTPYVPTRDMEVNWLLDHATNQNYFCLSLFIWNSTGVAISRNQRRELYLMRKVRKIDLKDGWTRMLTDYRRRCGERVAQKYKCTTPDDYEVNLPVISLHSKYLLTISIENLW